MTLARFKVTVTVPDGDGTAEKSVIVTVPHRDDAANAAILELEGNAIGVISVEDAPEEEIPEATLDDPIAEQQGMQESLSTMAKDLQGEPQGLISDDMIEWLYGPCDQCGSEMVRPLRLFPNESPILRLNCYHCHAGMGKGLDEMLQSGLGMLLRPMEEQPAKTQEHAAIGSAH